MTLTFVRPIRDQTIWAHMYLTTINNKSSHKRDLAQLNHREAFAVAHDEGCHNSDALDHLLLRTE